MTSAELQKIIKRLDSRFSITSFPTNPYNWLKFTNYYNFPKLSVLWSVVKYYLVIIYRRNGRHYVQVSIIIDRILWFILKSILWIQWGIVYKTKRNF